MLHPEEQKSVVGDGHEIGIHSWIHELNSQLPPENERDLQMRAADTLEKNLRSTSRWHPHAFLGLQRPYPVDHTRDGV